MDRYGLTPEKLQEILTQVNQALINHQQWYRELIRSITCKLPANEGDISHEPHKKCVFGKWYYSKDNLILVSHPSFSAVELKHKIMHEMAAKLLLESQAQNSISVINYDDFAAANEALQTELNDFKHEFENMLYERDSLTGATTRMSILPTLKEQQELILRGIQSDCCIALMDLDHFKTINDNFGHLVGDHVLSTVVQYLIEQLRPYDKVFRYGGEEFIILMQFTDLTTGHALIERLRKGIESLPINVDDNVLIKITASFGIAKLDPNLIVENTIEFADKAMYKAKAAGRNRVNIWDKHYT